MNKFMHIDLSASAVMAGNDLMQAVQSGMDPQAVMAQIAANSQRPWIDPKDPTREYVSIPEFGTNGDITGYVAQLRGNAAPTTLLKYEWEAIDKTVRGVAMGRMNIMNMFVAAGLTIPIDGMGTTSYKWRLMGQMGSARLDMDMTTGTDHDRMEFTEKTMPIPIISSGWDINMRFLAESRRMGMPMDVEYAKWAAFRCTEMAENIVVNGAGLKADGGQIEGLRTAASRLIGTALSADWTAATVTGSDIVEATNDWIKTLQENHHYGPYSMLLPQRYAAKLNEDYNPLVSDKSIRTRMLEIDGLSNITFSETLNTVVESGTKKYANEVFLIELKTETVAILDGMPLTDYEWQIKGPLVKEHKVAMIRVPLFRNDLEGQSGLLHAKVAGTAIP